jgi:DNA modification methylase
LSYIDKNPVIVDFDYRDSLSKDQINKILSDGIEDFESDLYDLNLDYISDTESYFIENDLYEKFEDELKKDFYATRAPFNNTHELMTDVWGFDTIRGEDRPDHPTPKPVEMMERIFKTSGTDDAVIYSPFLGSGTDIIAGQNCGRKVYGLEKDINYAAVILERFYAATGIMPEKL